MQGKHYKLVFSGKLLPGFELDAVKSNVARLFKTDTSKIEKLFSGQKMIIKDNIDLQTAQKYEHAMQAQGAVCSIVDKSQLSTGQAANDAVYQQQSQPEVVKSVPPPATQPAPAAEKQEGEDNIDSWMKGGSTVSDEEAANIQYEGHNETEDYAEPADNKLSEQDSVTSMDEVTVAEPGTTIIPPVQVEELDIDVSAFSMAQAGEVIMQHEPVADVDINTDNLELMEPGTKLDSGKG